MIMSNQELVDEKDKWQLILSSEAGVDDSIYELAFFKIYIKFEKFLSDTFEHYALGNNSIHGYCPTRRLEFEDQEHLHKVLRNRNNSFIKHFEIISQISHCFFSDNPFEIINTDSTYSNIVRNMKILRDYIAHESDSGRKKYVTQVLNDRPFIEPYQHLLSLNRNRRSYYTYYVESMIGISSFIINAPQPSEYL